LRDASCVMLSKYSTATEPIAAFDYWLMERTKQAATQETADFRFKLHLL
jgi:hypothetical protein